MTESPQPNPADSAAPLESSVDAVPPLAEDLADDRLPRSSGPITLYERGGHHIWAELNAGRSLVISGQDLRPSNGWEEYEYAFTVLSEDLPLIGKVLDAAGDSILQVLAANATRIVPGVKSWLDAAGVRYTFWSRVETDHG